MMPCGFAQGPDMNGKCYNCGDDYRICRLIETPLGKECLRMMHLKEIVANPSYSWEERFEALRRIR